MRYMMIVKATAATEAGGLPSAELVEAMDRYHEALARAGVLLDANGLRPSAQGWRVEFAGERGGERRIVGGPFADTGELVAGYTLIQVRSREEAMEWARRFPAPVGHDGVLEVRPLYEPEDLAPARRRSGVAPAGDSVRR